MALTGRRRALTDSKEVLRLANEYFAEREKKELPPFSVGLAHHLGISRNALWEYKTYKKPKSGESDVEANHEEMLKISAIIQEASQVCEMWLEENLLLKKTDTTGAIFSLKCNYKWDDGNKIMIQGDPDKPLAFQDLTETAIKSLGILEDYNYEPTELPQIDEKPEVSESGEDIIDG